MFESRIRISFVFSIIFLLFLVLIYRILNFQINPHKEIVDRSKKQFKGIVELTPKRGVIYDKYNNVLAVSRLVNSLYAEPFKIKNKKQVSKYLANNLGLTYKYVYKKINNDRYFVWIKRKLEDSLSKKIEDYVNSNNGLNFKKENKRFYPNQNIASHVLGYVNIDSIGRSGVERYYDKFLLSKKKKLVFEKDAKGRIINSNYKSFYVKESNHSVHLTIDSSLQYHVESELKETVNKWKAKNGTVIIMDPKNGEILCLANYPSYDPNDKSNYDPYVWKNRAITDIYEPGSTFKIITLATGLSGGFVGEDEIIDGEGGSFLVGKGKYARYIKEADGHDYGYMTLSELISKSSNVGSAKIGLRIGYDNMIKGIRKFNFGNKTNVDLIGEVNGIVRKSGGSVDLANMAFGQGIGVTPIQVIKAYSIIANNGYDIVPHVMKKVVKNDGSLVKKFKYENRKQVIDKKLAKNLKQMLRMVVSQGTAVATDINGFQIAGKTGTSEKYIDGKYSDEKYIASFVGFFPYEKPKYVMLTLIDEPKESYYASTVAVPLFRKIASYIIQKNSIEPNNVKEIDLSKSDLFSINKKKFDLKLFPKNTLPDVKGLSLKEVLNKLNADCNDIKVIGSGKIIKQLPKPGDNNMIKNKKITLWLE